LFILLMFDLSANQIVYLWVQQFHVYVHLE